MVVKRVMGARTNIVRARLSLWLLSYSAAHPQIGNPRKLDFSTENSILITSGGDRDYETPLCSSEK